MYDISLNRIILNPKIEKAKSKRKCYSCNNHILSGENCLSWLELPESCTPWRGAFRKRNLCLNCAKIFLKDTKKETNRLYKQIQYRQAHLNKVKKVLSRSR